ncbi:MAG: GTPase Era [Myxococcales bacterium FL481]|nr:MAG: GTPase Era [Myxococcales bacterium FL481]
MDLESQSAPAFRSGFVGLFGRPNVGKSTLLNTLIGEDLALATQRPQTTRERMMGVWTTPRFQAVLVDTPGIHRAKSALNRAMVDTAVRSVDDVDVRLLLADVPRVVDAEAAERWEPGEGAQAVLARVQRANEPVVLVLTKVDMLPTSALMLPLIRRWKALHEFAAVVPTSAVAGHGLDALRAEIERHLPEGPPLYDAEHLSDRPLRWHAAELIRGELFAALAQELPYSCAVTVESFDETPDRCQVRASVHVERESQKGIVIGAGARMIKRISAAARGRIGELAGCPCDLVLSVRVTPNWTKDPKQLEVFGYVATGDR